MFEPGAYGAGARAWTCFVVPSLVLCCDRAFALVDARVGPGAFGAGTLDVLIAETDVRDDRSSGLTDCARRLRRRRGRMLHECVLRRRLRCEW